MKGSEKTTDFRTCGLLCEKTLWAMVMYFTGTLKCMYVLYICNFLFFPSQALVAFQGWAGYLIFTALNTMSKHLISSFDKHWHKAVGLLSLTPPAQGERLRQEGFSLAISGILPALSDKLSLTLTQDVDYQRKTGLFISKKTQVR